MRHRSLRHRISCDEPTFWRMFFDPSLNELFYRDVIGFTQYVVDQRCDELGVVHRTIKGQPPLALPGPLARRFGNNLGYTEHGTFDPHNRIWSFTIVPNRLSKRVIIEGRVHVAPVAASEVDRIAELSATAALPILGGPLESRFVSYMEDAWNLSAEAFNLWFQQGEEAARDYARRYASTRRSR